MKTKREEKLEEKFLKLKESHQIVLKELHTCKQKIRDMEKSRVSYKSQVKMQAQAIDLLEAELKKKRYQFAFQPLNRAP
jgi:hypothetical protein